MLARSPWQASKADGRKRQQRLKREQREALIAAIARILRHGEPTAFRFEAYCYYGVRCGLILQQGFSWPLADATAAAVVRVALDQIGAKRPRWIEGQPNYAQLGALMICNNCWNCGKVLLGRTDVKYCGDKCRQQFHSVIVRPWLQDGDDAYKSATKRTRGLDEQHNA